MKAYEDMTVDELRAELARVKDEYDCKLLEIAEINYEILQLKGGAK